MTFDVTIAIEGMGAIHKLSLYITQELDCKMCVLTASLTSHPRSPSPQLPVTQDAAILNKNHLITLQGPLSVQVKESCTSLILNQKLKNGQV